LEAARCPAMSLRTLHRRVGEVAAWRRPRLVVAHSHPRLDRGSILPNAPLVRPSPRRLVAVASLALADGAALGRVLRLAHGVALAALRAGAGGRDLAARAFARSARRADTTRRRLVGVGTRWLGTVGPAWDLGYELPKLLSAERIDGSLMGTVVMAASAGDGWLMGQRQASGVANRSRCLFCGSAAGPFAEAD
jgi:hypothetical protein